MKAKIYELRWFWVAWTFTTGWPRRLFHFHCKRHEYIEDIWHIGVVGLGYSFEFRFGPL